MKVDFATFCYSGDAHRLHAPGQLKKQVESNGYPFNEVIVIYQQCNPFDYPRFDDIGYTLKFNIIVDIDDTLKDFGIDINKSQYHSPTDSHHTWKPHVVNHIAGIKATEADYIVFADNDCWIVNQPDSWVEKAINILQLDPDIFIVSPNDGEPERITQRMSQQMFCVKVEDFRQADFNQPGYSGNPADYPEMPEYHGMLEGRMSYYCRSVNRWRYVLGPEYRYFHHNRLTPEGLFDTDYERLGWL